MVTPPVGMNLFVVHGIAKDVSIGMIIRGVLPLITPALFSTIIHFPT